MEIVFFGEDQTPVNPKDLAPLRQYAKDNPTRGYYRFWTPCGAKKKTQQEQREDKAAADKIRWAQPEVKAADAQRKRTSREGAPEAEKEAEREAKKTRMASSRKSKTPEESAAARTAHSKLMRILRGGSPDRTQGQRRKDNRANLTRPTTPPTTTTTTQPTLSAQTPQPQSNQSEQRPQPQVQPQGTVKAVQLTYKHAGDSPLAPGGVVREVPVMDAEESSLAWLSIVDSLVDEHAALLSPNSDIEITVTFLTLTK